MFSVLFGALAVLVYVLFSFGLYIFAAYVLSRLGEKFRTGSFIRFLIPFYNVMLLCDCANISRWFTVALLAPVAAGVVVDGSSFSVAANIVVSCAALIGIASNVYLWGTVADKLGKNFWLWGIATPLLFALPVLILAFDGSMPKLSGAARVSLDGETRYIDV